jgi:hypothetical protein
MVVTLVVEARNWERRFFCAGLPHHRPEVCSGPLEDRCAPMRHLCRGFCAARKLCARLHFGFPPKRHQVSSLTRPISCAASSEILRHGVRLPRHLASGCNFASQDATLQTPLVRLHSVQAGLGTNILDAAGVPCVSPGMGAIWVRCEAAPRAVERRDQRSPQHVPPVDGA